MNDSDGIVLVWEGDDGVQPDDLILLLDYASSKSIVLSSPHGLNEDKFFETHQASDTMDLLAPFLVEGYEDLTPIQARLKLGLTLACTQHVQTETERNQPLEEESIQAEGEEFTEEGVEADTYGEDEIEEYPDQL